MAIPEGYAEVTHLFTGPAVPLGAAVVYGVILTVEETPMETALQAHGCYEGSLLVRQTDNTTLAATRVKYGPDETGPSAEYTASPANGGQTTESGTPQQAYLFTKTTALGGRRGKGRMYVPGVSEPVVDMSGIVTPVFTAGNAAAGAAFLSDLDGAGIPMCLLHGPATEWVLVDGQPRRVPVAGPVPEPTLVTGLAASNLIATQRRRLRG